MIEQNTVYPILRVIQNQMPNTDEVNIPVPVESPSIPLIKLKPFTITRKTKIVKRMRTM